MSVSIMITTHNREDDLDRTLQTISKLDPPPAEVIVTADGCDDGTIDLINRKYPETRLIVNEKNRGSIASRDFMLRTAKSDIVLSLDDDSYPIEQDSIARLGQLFDDYPSAGVIHFPQISDEFPESLAGVQETTPMITASYSNAGAGYRRSVYLDLPGFFSEFFHAYEEPDYALQLLSIGYSVIEDPTITIRHHYSPIERSEIRTHHRHARNECLSALLRCPFPLVLLLVPYRLGSQFVYATKRGLSWVIREPAWWWSFIASIGNALGSRSPIDLKIYRQWLELSKNPKEVSAQ